MGLCWFTAKCFLVVFGRLRGLDFLGMTVCACDLVFVCVCLGFGMSILGFRQFVT